MEAQTGKAVLDPELGLQAAATRPGQALQDQLSPAPSEGVSYKEKEKAFLIRVLFPLLLWASRAWEGGCL